MFSDFRQRRARTFPETQETAGIMVVMAESLQGLSHARMVSGALPDRGGCLLLDVSASTQDVDELGRNAADVNGLAR
jgi:hypothetical protein